MSLAKTSLLNAASMFVKMLTQLGLSKILAVYVGPAGYGLLGQFQNFVQVVVQLSGGLLNTGITKYTAEYEEDEKKQQKLWQTASFILFTGSLAAFLMILLFRDKLAYVFLHDRQYGSVFGWFACSIFFIAFNAFFLAILNGKQLFSKYVGATILGCLISFIVTAVLATSWGTYGCLIAMVVNASFGFFTTLIVCLKMPWFRLSYFIGVLNKPELKSLCKFALMSLTSILCVPTTQLLIRNYISTQIDWDAAGCWEAMSRISSTYLMFITSTLAVYYLPKLSSLKNKHEIKAEVINGYKFILPLGIIFSLMMYLFKDVIIHVLLSSSFLPIQELFGWQLVGDTFKIASFLIAYIYVAKGHAKLYIFSEILFSGLYFLFVVLLFRNFNLKATSIAYALTYMGYFLFVLCSLRTYFFEEKHLIVKNFNTS